MIRNASIFILFSLCLFSCQQQGEQKANKKIWAKSVINQKAPELVVEKWLSEKPDLANKYLLIDFWATWCPYCVQIIPELNLYHNEFKDKLVVIGISDQSEEVVKKVSPSIEYYNAIDPQQRMYESLEIQGIPHCIIVNPEGIVVWEGFPLSEEDPLTMEVVKKLINQ